MNIYIGFLFKLIPLIMGIICALLGLNLLNISTTSEYFIASHVLISLSAICLALFTTATIIIRQLTHGVNQLYNTSFACIGYMGSITTMVWSVHIFSSDTVTADYFVAGHVVFGIGMIAACVSTVAAASRHFTLIPQNSAGDSSNGTPKAAYSRFIGNILIAIPVTCSIIGYIWAAILLSNSKIIPYYIAGHVLLGLSAICTCLIALVSTVVRQTRNVFSKKEQWFWCYWVIFFASATVILGVSILLSHNGSYRIAPGMIIICLSMICFSILSKVWLLALVWRRTCTLANRIPMIPIITCLFCLFLAAFLSNFAATDNSYFIPSKVLVGLGAVCFTLFSIVSILEAGSSKK